MNFQVIWSAIQPLLTQLLQSPQFKGLVDQIWSDLIAKVAAGAHPEVATQQAQGKVAAAALLHLTGNPIADFGSLISNLQPHAGAAPVTPAPGSVIFPS